MNITEAGFKKRVITALSKEGIRTIDLRSGTFDLFLDEGRRCFLELKIANRHYKRRAKGLGISLIPQTTALRLMKNMPIVLACNCRDANECYLALPKHLRKLVNVRNSFPNVLIGVQHLQPHSFDNAMTMIIRYLGASKKAIQRNA